MTLLNAHLRQAVEEFAARTQSLTDDQLERPWTWQSYDSEGIRFAFFRTYEELRELAGKLHYQRLAEGTPWSQAQMILGRYHAAYLDLQAALLAVDGGQLDETPADGGWSLREVLRHMLGAEVGFYVVVRYALNRHRNGDQQPAEFSKEDRVEISGIDEAAFNSTLAGSWESIHDWQRAFHERILYEFAEIGDAELEQTSTYWEDEPMSLRFRLHRFDSHMRQHTIQVDKTRIALQQSPNEAKRLLRLMYSALADIDGALIGDWQRGEASRDTLAQAITTRAQEIAAEPAS